MARCHLDAPAVSRDTRFIGSFNVIMGRLKTLTLLGSTGSIGVSTLDVVGRHPEKYRVHALVAGANVDLLVRQIERFRPQIAVTATEASQKKLTTRLTEVGLPCQSWPQLGWGPQARVDAA